MAPTASTSQHITIEPELSLLVSLAHETPLPNDPVLPRELFEPQAVASATTIGAGSTFRICRQRVPPAQDVRCCPADIEGVVVTSTSNRAKTGSLPKYVVYKVAQVEFTKEGRAIPDHRQKLVATLLELLALTHDPILRHPYLPSLLGFAWGQNSFQVDQRIPVPVLGFAEYGNLADLQKCQRLEVEETCRLCWQVGTALVFLHDCQIQHGDVKSENVLVYRVDGNRMQARLTDFGLSVLSNQGSLNFVPPGTLLWAAPELRWRSDNSIPVSLDKADTFSYGLFVWRVFCEGYDPLGRCFLAGPAAVSERETTDSLDALHCRPDEACLRKIFESDQLIAVALSFSWLAHVVLLRTQQFLRSVTGLAQSQHIPLQDELASNYKNAELKRSEQVRSEFQLTAVFKATLSPASEKRNLRMAVEALSKGRDFHKPSIKPQSFAQANNRRLHAVAFNGHPISWLAMRGLDPIVATFIFRHRLERAANEKTPHLRTGLFLGNAACLLSGMGSDMHVDVEEALKALTTSARHNNLAAAALVYRVHNAYERDVPDDINYLIKLQNAAIHGSVAAYEDLRVVASELAPYVRYSLSHQTCGIGASIFWDVQCLNGWSFADRDKLDWISEVLRLENDELWKVRVNKRGDTLLHAAAALWIPWLLDTLLLERDFPLDVVNDVGETPLLCAVRSGANDMAHTLLDRGAEPSIISSRGESPLHWVMSITEFGYARLIAKLVDKGALPTLTCWADLCDYSANNIEAFHHYSERLSRGTPLHWAICRKKAYLALKLLNMGAPTNFYGPSEAFYTPLEQAAHLHESNILRLLIDKTVTKPRTVAFATAYRATIHSQPVGTPLVDEKTILRGLPEMIKAAINGSDRFLMLQRHGDRYRSRLRETFRILGEELKYIKFTRGVDNLDSTPLRYAVSWGYEEAVEQIIRYMDGGNDVDVRQGHMGWTPLCDAIRRNHRGIFRQLLDHGADVKVRVDNPGCAERYDWGLLHIAAQSVVLGDLTIVRELLTEQHGLKIDSYGTPHDPAESPLYTALEHDHFGLATLLRERGAKVNATSRYISRGRMRLAYQTTILGRIIASCLRFSKHRLHYLLYPPPETPALTQQVDFIVVPNKGYTALHLSLMDYDDVDDDLLAPEEQGSQEWDGEVKDEIFRIVLERYDKQEEINMRTVDLNAEAGQSNGQTALHIAARKGNLPAVKLLVDNYGADVRATDGRGRLAVEVAREALLEMEHKVRKKSAGLDEKKLRKVKDIIKILEEV